MVIKKSYDFLVSSAIPEILYFILQYGSCAQEPENFRVVFLLLPIRWTLYSWESCRCMRAVRATQNTRHRPVKYLRYPIPTLLLSL